MIWDDILALSVGASAGLQERRNEEMRRQGIRPTFWQRHIWLRSLVPIAVGLVLGPVIFIGVIFGAIDWGVFVNEHIDNNTHLWLWCAAYLAPFVLLWWIVRSIRRWRRRKRPAGTSLVSVRRVP